MTSLNTGNTHFSFPVATESEYDQAVNDGKVDKLLWLHTENHKESPIAFVVSIQSGKKQEKKTPIALLKIDSKKGLIAATLPGKKSASYDVDTLINHVAKNAVSHIPTVLEPDLNGSVLLAIAANAIKRSIATVSGIRLNAPTETSDLSANDWIDAYLEVEAAIGLNPSQNLAVMNALRQEFNAILIELKITGSIALAQSVETNTPIATIEKTKQTQAVKQSVGI